MSPRAAFSWRRYGPLVVASLGLGSCLLAGCGPADPPAPDKIGTGGDAAYSDGSSDAQLDAQPACTRGHQRLELGALTTGKDGNSPALEFDVPPCTRSFVITVAGDSRFHYTLAELTPIGHISLVPKAWIQISASPMVCLTPCANRIVAQPAAAAFLFPNTPLVDVAPGRHRLRVYAFQRAIAGVSGHLPVVSKVEVHVDVVLGPALDEGPLKLPINLCLTGAGGVSAEGALKHPRVSAAMIEFGELMAPAGISAGPVRFFDVPASHRFIGSIDGPDSDLARLFRSGAGLPVGLNIFLVEKIAVATGGPPGTGTILGLSGGIPGPPRAMGCDRCGVVFALQQHAGQADLLGGLMAHEVAHYLGLFHSTEPPDSEGKAIQDNILDTKADDQLNLMYWAVTEQSRALSPQQRVVLRLNPWLVPEP